MKYYKADWGVSLILISSLASAMLIGMTVCMLWLGAQGRRDAPPSWLSLLPVLIVLGCALFTVRGYTILPGQLWVHRLFWATRISLAGLQSASYEPKATAWTLRTFGNGGLFSFSGWHYNRRLGSFRSFLTNLTHTVVLRCPDKTIVVSPVAPEEFIRDIIRLQHV